MYHVMSESTLYMQVNLNVLFLITYNVKQILTILIVDFSKKGKFKKGD